VEKPTVELSHSFSNFNSSTIVHPTCLFLRQRKNFHLDRQDVENILRIFRESIQDFCEKRFHFWFSSGYGCWRESTLLQQLITLAKFWHKDWNTDAFWFVRPRRNQNIQHHLDGRYDDRCSTLPFIIIDVWRFRFYLRSFRLTSIPLHPGSGLPLLWGSCRKDWPAFRRKESLFFRTLSVTMAGDDSECDHNSIFKKRNDHV
jgi:hypothetical protein